MIFMLQFHGGWKKSMCIYLQFSSKSEVTSSFRENIYKNVLLMPNKMPVSWHLCSTIIFQIYFHFNFLVSTFSAHNFGHMIFLSNIHIYLYTLTLMLILSYLPLFFAGFLPVCHLLWVMCDLSHLCKSWDCLCSRLF